MATLLRRATLPLLVVVLFTAGLTGQTPATGASQTQTPAPVQILPGTTPRPAAPEATALTAAAALRDPAERLAALEKIKTDFPKATNLAAVDSQILSVLVNTWPDRIQAITDTFERILSRIAPTATPELRLSQTIAPVNVVIARKLLLDRSEQLMTDAVAALDFQKYAQTQRDTMKRLNQPEPTELQLKSGFGGNEARGLEVLARIHLARGDNAKAESFYRRAVDSSAAFGSAVTSLVDIYVGRKEYDKAEAVLNASVKAALTPAAASRPTMALIELYEKKGDDAKLESVLAEAMKTSPPVPAAVLKYAKLEARRGNHVKALDLFVTAAAGTNLTPADGAVMRETYRKVKPAGTDAELDGLIDDAYREKFPNPVKPAEFTPLPNRTNRMVLLEMFTGSGCGPCVAADLAFDAVMDRYPAGTIVPIAYHENIPAPDPMVTAGTNERINYYGRRAVPTFTIDGGMGRLGGGGRPNAQVAYNDYIAKIDKALQTPATAALSVSATVSGDVITVTTDVTKLPADTKDLRLHILVVEKHLRFMGENGIRFHPMVVRASAGPLGTGIPISATGRTEQTFSLKTIKDDITNTLKAEIDRRRTTSPAAQYAADGHAYVAINTDELVAVAFIQQGAYRGTPPAGPIAGVEGVQDAAASAIAPTTAPRPAAPAGPLTNVLQAAMADVKPVGSKGRGQ